MPLTISFEYFLLSILQNAFNAEYNLILSIIVRTVIVTFLILFIIRWLGNKGLGQLTTFELIILVGLGSAVGDPMIYADEISIPQAFTAIIIVVILFKVFDYLTMKSTRFSRLTVPEAILLVKDGQMVDNGLHKARIDDREFESYMRLHGIEDISDVKLSYLEVNGQVSFLSEKETHKGGNYSVNSAKEDNNSQASEEIEKVI
ncbi:MAG: DUF421 domain-containing protein [Nitrososphaeraceae archaeon]|nr:DUF421 domain-containing protein [Nitrososphaeraceae archaeon]